MKVHAMVAIALVGGVACGSEDQPRKPSLTARTCAEPMYGSLTAGGTLRAERGLKVGLVFKRGGGEYRVTSARVEVLAPDARLHTTAGSDPIQARVNKPVLVREEHDFEAADRELTVTFSGQDASGNALPPGRYPVVMEISTKPAGRCQGGGARVSGVLTMLDWQG